MAAPFPSHWGGFDPSALFAHGEQGVWYDPTDLSSMFQDSAGTTAVTGVEQPVGKILDKSGRGNHATQSTSASRPVLSARVNLLTKTQVFNDAVWATSSNVTVTNNTTDTTDPLGGNTASKFVEVATTATHRTLQTNITPASNSTYVLSVYAKKGTRQWVWVNLNATDAGNANGTNQIQYYDLDGIALGTQVAQQSVGSTVMTVFVSAAITDAGNGWRRLSITATAQNTPGALNISVGLASANGTNSYLGSTSDYGYFWGADVRPTNQGVNLPPYQRVNTSTDYDTAGFPLYLKFDGVDDSLATASFDLSATSNVSLFSSLRKASDAAAAQVVEFSATSATNNGTFGLWAPSTTTLNNYYVRAKGSLGNDIAYTTYTAPISNVLSSSLTSVAANATAAISTRINGSAVTGTPTSNNSTGNFGNFPLYIGSRGGTTNYLNGNLYGLIVRGASTSTPQLTATENWLRLRGRVY